MSDVLKFIAGAAKAKVEAVPVGDGVVHVRGMNSVHRAAFGNLLLQAKIENSDVPDHVIVAWGICEADGSRPDKPAEEILGALEFLDSQVLNRLAAKVLDLSGFGRVAMENAEKNPQPAGTTVLVPAGTGSRKDRRAAASRARSVRRRR